MCHTHGQSIRNTSGASMNRLRFLTLSFRSDSCGTSPNRQQPPEKNCNFFHIFPKKTHQKRFTTNRLPIYHMEALEMLCQIKEVIIKVFAEDVKLAMNWNVDMSKHFRKNSGKYGEMTHI